MSIGRAKRNRAEPLRLVMSKFWFFFQLRYHVIPTLPSGLFAHVVTPLTQTPRVLTHATVTSFLFIFYSVLSVQH